MSTSGIFGEESMCQVGDHAKFRVDTLRVYEAGTRKLEATVGACAYCKSALMESDEYDVVVIDE